MESTPTAPRSRRDDDDDRGRRSSPFHDPVRARAADAMASTSTPKVLSTSKRGKNSNDILCASFLSLSRSHHTHRLTPILLLAQQSGDGKDAVGVVSFFVKVVSKGEKESDIRPKTTVAFGRTTLIRDFQTKKQTVFPREEERAIERDPPVESDGRSARAHECAQKTLQKSFGRRELLETAPSPRVKRAMEYARHRMMERTHHARDGSASSSQNMTTSERVARILAAAKAKSE